jgi:cytochrome c-type biogenesis protein CcmE
MNKKFGKIIGIVIIVACLGYAMFLAKSSLVTNVPFSEAAAATDTTVQIMGAPVPGTMAYDSDAHLLHFAIKDSTGAVMPVQFAGPKPEDLDTAMARATKIGAQGTYSRAKGVFVAENLVVKCPSKYDGAKSEERTYGKA